jgi:hypothetical protein
MMHGMDKSCRLAAQDKGGRGLSADTEQLLGPRLAGSVEQKHDVGAVAWNCSVFCPVDRWSWQRRGVCQVRGWLHVH